MNLEPNPRPNPNLDTRPRTSNPANLEPEKDPQPETLYEAISVDAGSLGRAVRPRFCPITLPS